MTERGDRASPAVLEVVDLSVHYAMSRGPLQALLRRPKRVAEAVCGVDFSVHAGEMLALIGESGSGKTSAGLAALGLVAANSGHVMLEGRDLATLRPRELNRLRRWMQVVYQDPYEALDPRFNIGRTIEEPLRIHSIEGSRRARQALVSEAVERVGLTPASQYLDRYPHELSGGQRQRVAIAASLVVGPKLLVADEPVSMLDVSVRAGILSLLAELRRDGLAILMITHDIATASHVADRIVVMYLGRVVETGSTPSVLGDPGHPYTRALLDAVPRIRSSSPSRSVLRGEVPDATQIPNGCRFHPRCPVAEERCLSVDPKLRAVDLDAEHQAACVLVGDASEDEALVPG